MRGKRKITFLVIVVVGALLLATPWRPATSGWSYYQFGHCRMDGAWVKKSDPDCNISVETVTPGISVGSKWGSVMQIVTQHPSFGIPFPPFSDADSLSSFFGVVTRTGLDAYEFTLRGYGTKPVQTSSGREIAYICIINGSGQFANGDTREETYYMSLFKADQDSDFDGLPDQGEDAFLFLGPVTATAKRVQMGAPAAP